MKSNEKNEIKLYKGISGLISDQEMTQMLGDYVFLMLKIPLPCQVIDPSTILKKGPQAPAVQDDINEPYVSQGNRLRYDTVGISKLDEDEDENENKGADQKSYEYRLSIIEKNRNTLHGMLTAIHKIENESKADTLARIYVMYYTVCISSIKDLLEKSSLDLDPKLKKNTSTKDLSIITKAHHILTDEQKLVSSEMRLKNFHEHFNPKDKKANNFFDAVCKAIINFFRGIVNKTYWRYSQVIDQKIVPTTIKRIKVNEARYTLFSSSPANNKRSQNNNKLSSAEFKSDSVGGSGSSVDSNGDLAPRRNSNGDIVVTEQPNYGKVIVPHLERNSSPSREKDSSATINRKRSS